MKTLERKFRARYTNMSEREYWWFVERCLEELFETGQLG